MAVRRGARILAAAVACLFAAAGAFAQFGGFGRGPFRVRPNIPYDGRFTFVRAKYDTAPGGYWYGGWPAWGHGYPVAEQNLMRIMNELSYLNPHTDEINAIALDDPEIFKYPVAYIIEVDWWAITDSEVASLRAYLQKGGFLIVDDFKPRRFRGDFEGWGAGWEVFEAAMKRVIPGGRFFDMDASHGIFHAFFEIPRLDIVPQAYINGRPIFRGMYEDNDPSRRLQVIVNYNTDISQYWEWSGTGLRPIDDTNEAYKLGVNYIVYGMTH